MMKSYLHKVLAVILAAVFILATSGIAVFHHFCSTEKTSEYAVFYTDFNCDQEHDSHKGDEISSCCIADQQSCSENQCCNTETKVFKLDIDLDSQKTIKLSLDQKLISVNEKLEPSEPITVNIGMIYFYHDLPPPLSGKDLKIYLHQLNIPQYVV